MQEARDPLASLFAGCKEPKEYASRIEGEVARFEERNPGCVAYLHLRPATRWVCFSRVRNASLCAVLSAAWHARVCV